MSRVSSRSTRRPRRGVNEVRPLSGPDPLEERVWEAGWEAHAQAQRRRLSRLTFAEKLEWLEGAHQTVLLLQPSRPWAGHDEHRDDPRPKP